MAREFGETDEMDCGNCDPSTNMKIPTEGHMPTTKTLSSENIDEVCFDKVMFCTIAEGGAMGDPGSMLLYEYSAGALRQFYVNQFDRGGQVVWEEVLRRLKLFDGKTLSQAWVHVYLGYGNHLHVAQEVFPAFETVTKEMDVAEVFRFLPQFVALALGVEK